MHIETSASVLGGLKGMSDSWRFWCSLNSAIKPLPGRNQSFSMASLCFPKHSPFGAFSVALGAQDYQWARWITPHPSWWPPFFSLSMVTFLRDQEAHQWDVAMAGGCWLVCLWRVDWLRMFCQMLYCRRLRSFWTCTSPTFAPLHRGCFTSHFFSTAFKSFRMIFFFRFLQSGSSPRVVIGPFCQSSHPWGLISWNEMELHDS